MVTASMFLSVFLLSGAVADCPVALSITAPKQMEGLSGSCLQIPCSFSAAMGVQPAFDGTRTTYGIWIKNTVDFANNPNDVIFNSSNKDNSIYSVSLTGDLSKRNCTTLFSSLITSDKAEYFFRVENQPFIATAACDPVQITVTDSAPRPRIEISGGVTDLKEKQSVTITCSALTPCPHSPPKLTWTLQQDPHSITEQNTDGTVTTQIQETITLSHTHDGLNISCSAGYPVNGGADEKTAEEEITLSVSYAPKETSVSISPPGLVSAGSWVNLTCSSRANPPVSRFTWFKNNEAFRVSVEDVILHVTDGGGYHCVATNALGNGTSPVIRLTTGSSLLWGRVLGGVIGILVLIGLIVFVWRFKSTQQTESQTGGELTVKEPASKTEEDIHYGEIDFSKRRPEPSSASEKDSGQQQETPYAEIKVSKTANSLAQPAEGPEDLYAQVKRK